MRYVVPLIPRFLEQYPEITLDLVLSDTVVDLMQERADVAIRNGALRDSSLAARKPGTGRMAVVSFLDYTARHETPAHPADLTRHKGTGLPFSRPNGGCAF